MTTTSELPASSAVPVEAKARGPVAARAAVYALRKVRDFVVTSALAIAAIMLVATALHLLTTPSLSIRTLEDGHRKVTFIEMFHVAGPAFYGRVRDRIALEGSHGASLLYEGIDGTVDEINRFSGVAGNGPGEMGLMTFLTTMADMAGLQVQPDFSGLTGRRDVWADLSVSDVLGADPGAAATGLASYVRSGAVAVMGWCRARGLLAPDGMARPVVGALVRPLITFVLVPMRLGIRMPNDLDRSSRLRERRLVEVMRATPGDVVITYGAGHYPGFRELLGQGWREVATEDNPIFR